MNNIKVKDKMIFLGKEIPVIEGGFGEGKRCLTDKAIAEIHSTEVRSIRQTIERNMNRFKKDIDFIDMKQITNSDLFQELDFTKAQIGNSKHIYLLSERGYAKLIKIMDTDLAWEIHDKIIDEYFTMRETIRTLSKEQELVLNIYEGGIVAIEAHKELVGIKITEVKKEEEEKREVLKRVHKININKKEKDIEDILGANKKLLSTTDLVSLLTKLGVKGLTTTILNEYFVSIGLGEMRRFEGERRRTFTPNELFKVNMVDTGYATLNNLNEKGKTKVNFTVRIIGRFEDTNKNHLASLQKFINGARTEVF